MNCLVLEYESRDDTHPANHEGPQDGLPLPLGRGLHSALLSGSGGGLRRDMSSKLGKQPSWKPGSVQQPVTASLAQPVTPHCVPQTIQM